MLAAPAVRIRSTGSGRRTKRGHRGLDRLRVVVDVVDGHDLRAQTLDLGPDARLELGARRRADRFLDDDPDPPRQERGDPHDRVAAEAGQPCPGVDRGGIDHVRRDLDARDEVAGLDDLAVERGEDLERVDPVEPFELRDPDVEDARRLGDQVDPALVRAANGQPGTGHGGGETKRSVILVQLPGFRHEDRHRLPRLGRGDRREVVRGQTAALRPALAGDRQVTGQDRPDQARRRAPPRRDALDLHGWVGPDDQRSRARAASIARRV